jgi:hypothetical protein
MTKDETRKGKTPDSLGFHDLKQDLDAEGKE